MVDTVKLISLCAALVFLAPGCRESELKAESVNPVSPGQMVERAQTYLPPSEPLPAGTVDAKTPCPSGKHNDGNGHCAPKFACAEGFAVLDNGRCGQVFKASPPVYPWSHQLLKTHDGRIFLFGWRYRQRMTAGMRTGFGPRVAFLYDPEDHTWTQLAAPPAPRTRPGIASMTGGRVLLAGGIDWKRAGPEMSARVDIYDPKADSWRPAKPLPSPRANPVMMGLTDGSVIVAGGEGPDDESTPLFQYSPEDDAWNTIAESSFQLRGDAVQTFELPDGDVLFVPGCTVSADATEACPLRRLDVDTGKWQEIGDDTWLIPVAARLQNGRIFVFNKQGEAAIYDPKGAPGDALIHLEQVGRTPLKQVESAFAIDDETVALVDLPQRTWVLELDETNETFEVTDDHREGALERATSESSFVALGPGEAFALLGAKKNDPSFIPPKPTGLRLALDTDGVGGLDQLRPWWQSPAAYSALPMTAPVVVDDVDGGRPSLEQRSPEAVLDWLAAAWAADKKPDWISDELEVQTAGTKLRSSVDEDGVLDPSLLVADFDDDGHEDLAVRFAADCGQRHRRVVPACSWVTALLPASGGWVLLGTASEATYAREMPLELRPAVDFTGDGVPELVLQQVIRANHADWTRITIFSVHNAPSLRPILLESEYLRSLKTAHGLRKQRIDIVTPDERTAFIEVAFGFGAYAGAGRYQRATLQRWEWNPDTRRIGPVPARKGGTRGYRWEQTPERNRKRIHRLGDALYALEAHDYKEAERLFDEVVSGSDVYDTFGGSKNRNPERRARARAQFRQYALFMLGRIALELGNAQKLARVKHRLRTNFPAGPMPAALDELKAEYVATNDMGLACKRKAPSGREAFGDEWVFRQSFADHPPVEFGANFGDRGLCAGLDAFPQDYQTETDLLEPGYLRVRFHIRDPDDREVALLARNCSSRDGECSDRCEIAQTPGHEDGVVRARATTLAPPNEFVWKLDCENISQKQRATLCLTTARGGEPAMEIQRFGREICGRQ